MNAEVDSDQEAARAKSETEAVPAEKVALLKRGLLILIIFGIFMLIATAWYMTKRYWH